MAPNSSVSRTRNEHLAFEIYLRTGKIIAFDKEEDLQVKFNPWHNPENGRFTFAGQGTYFGSGAPPGYDRPVRAAAQRSTKVPDPSGKPDSFRPGGGTFGGGGADGSWPSPPINRRPKTQQKPTRPITASPATPSSVRTKKPVLPALVPVVRKSPVRRIVKNGYNFDVSSEKESDRRTERISGVLRIGEGSQRSRRAQSEAGGANRKPTDDGGHFIAVRFDGPHNWFNHFAQDSKFNRGVYRGIEDSWARDVKAGKRVFVSIVPHYTGRSTRPDKLTVRWIVDNTEHTRIIPNSRRGK